MSARLDLTLTTALARCNAAGCTHIGAGGKCLLHTRLDQAGMPSQKSEINRKEYAPRTTKAGRPIPMKAAPVYVTQVIECEVTGKGQTQ